MYLTIESMELKVVKIQFYLFQLHLLYNCSVEKIVENFCYITRYYRGIDAWIDTWIDTWIDRFVLFYFKCVILISKKRDFCYDFI